ncbi:MAG: 2-amino-4-hydroxy-6-hydroxymethyldihydropteridine diphosphokinase [Alphaproteobacteria bacterium]|nr:2-amino-4-hydroxy-6-hydroxymethyldihydropteridine diphosphokinase [Alphaproteobacteria bacterium]
MIVIALGANLPTEAHGSPEAGLAAALAVMPAYGIKIVRQSRLYRSAPVPPSGQPWYVNAVAVVETTLGPRALLAALLAIETCFGRVRSGRNDARVLDLDLLDHDGQIGRWPAEGTRPALDLPHPRLTTRAFVLMPLAALAPDWRHPVTGTAIGALIAALAPDQVVEVIGKWPGEA